MKSILIRKKIIRTAADLFYHQGYNSSGINEVIAKADVAKATLYGHFNSKEDLCVAYIKYQQGKFIKRIEKYLNENAANTNEILTLFDFLATFFDHKNFNGCCCTNLIAEIPKDNTKIRKEVWQQKKELNSLIKRAVNNTYISNTERENKNIAIQVYLLFQTALVESHLYQEKWPIETARNMCIQLLEKY